MNQKQNQNEQHHQYGPSSLKRREQCPGRSTPARHSVEAETSTIALVQAEQPPSRSLAAFGSYCVLLGQLFVGELVGRAGPICQGSPCRERRCH